MNASGCLEHRIRRQLRANRRWPRCRLKRPCRCHVPSITITLATSLPRQRQIWMQAGRRGRVIDYQRPCHLARRAARLASGSRLVTCLNLTTQSSAVCSIRTARGALDGCISSGVRFLEVQPSTLRHEDDAPWRTDAAGLAGLWAAAEALAWPHDPPLIGCCSGPWWHPHSLLERPEDGTGRNLESLVAPASLRVRAPWHCCRAAQLRDRPEAGGLQTALCCPPAVFSAAHGGIRPRWLRP